MYGLQPILLDAMPTVFDGDFEWDSAKAASNLIKHGVSFPEAATVFADPYAVYLDDGSGIGRLVVIGTSLRERLLYVVHVERGERDRIISARPATGGEREVYETGEHSCAKQPNERLKCKRSPFGFSVEACALNAGCI
jgi:hypothetical protein